MALEQNNEQHYREVPDKFHDPVATYQMTTRDYVMRPAAAAAMIITLPPVAEAKGSFYSIVARSASAIRTITITDKNDSECWLGDIVMNGKCDRILLYSDGLCWIALGNAGDWPGLSTTPIPGTEAPTTAAPTTARATTIAPTTTQATTVASTTLAPTTAG